MIISSTKIFFISLFTLYILVIPLSTTNSKPKPLNLKFQWPIQKGTLPDLKGITSTFAESRTDHFHNGVDIASFREPVKPVLAGKVLYSREIQDDPWNPMPGPGNFIIIKHKKGWMSGYYHLRQHKIKRSGVVTKDTIIGKSGNSGHSSGSHLHFYIANKLGQSMQNPLSFLPQITDTNPPHIGPLILKTSKGETRLRHSKIENIRLTKPWPFLVSITDPGLEKNSRRGVYKLTWTLNNQKRQTKNFNSIEMYQDKWLLERKYKFSETYKHNYYNLGTLNIVNGINTLRLTVSDIIGNTSTVIYEINVKKEY